MILAMYTSLSKDQKFYGPHYRQSDAECARSNLDMEHRLEGFPQIVESVKIPSADWYRDCHAKRDLHV